MNTTSTTPRMRQERFLPLTVGAIGVVYGDIGTSPLYAMKEAFGKHFGVAPTISNVLGISSLIFWSLIIVVSLKYMLFIMRADNKGEGGIMALLALTLRVSTNNNRSRWFLITLGLFGGALFYGDGAITPAISVLSAVEGLKFVAPALESYVIPITLGILIALFLFQRQGTASIGALFGPIMVIWFLTLAALGLNSIIAEPQILRALNPIYAVQFFQHHQWHSFVALGAVVLVLTGAEVLYADMGHFGRPAIRAAWFWFVLPSLLLNYFGQAALIMRDPAAAANPFYLLAPSWAIFGLVILATVATIIASQAAISGTFSITRQAIQLGYFPRLKILYTSRQKIGQIYLPLVNWSLLVAVILLVLGFGSSSNLAAAYGISVTGTMVITTLLALVIAHYQWGWSWLTGIIFLGVFIIIDIAFFSANLNKIPEGGWVAMAIGIALFTLMSTWKKGREVLMSRLHANAIALEPFLKHISQSSPLRVSGSAIFLTADREGVPHALLHNLAHNKVLHERVIFLTVITEDVPWVPKSERLKIESLGSQFFRLTIRYGFKQDPDIPRALEQAKGFGLDFNMLETSFFLSRETLIPTQLPGMAIWRERLFIGMARNASSAMTFFRLPTNRVLELGTQIEL